MPCTFGGTPVTMDMLLGFVSEGMYPRPRAYAPPPRSISCKRGISPRESPSSRYRGSPPSIVKTTVGCRGKAYCRPVAVTPSITNPHIAPSCWRRAAASRGSPTFGDVQYVAIAVGAMLGANLRFVIGQWAADRFGADLPYGTFL